MHVGEARFTFGHPYSYPKGWGPSVLTFEGFSSTYAYTLWRKGCASGAVVSALYCNFEVLCSIPGRDECNVFSILLVRKTPNSKCYNTYAEGRVLGCHPRHWIFAQSHREVCRRYSKFLVISRDIKHTRYGCLLDVRSQTTPYWTRSVALQSDNSKQRTNQVVSCQAPR